MDQVKLDILEGSLGGSVENARRPQWRTPELCIESVAALTGIDPGSPGDDGSLYPNHGFFS